MAEDWEITATENEQAVWDRLPEESAEAFRAFCDYRAMGKASAEVLWDRYRNEMADPPTRRLRTLTEWRARYHWVKRRQAWVEFQADMEAEAAAQKAREVGERQARDAARLQAVAMCLLEDLAGYDEETGEFLFADSLGGIDVARLWKLGFESERTLAGLVSQIKERRVNDMSELSDEELDKIIGG